MWWQQRASAPATARELVGCALEMRTLRVILPHLEWPNADRTGTQGLAAAVACGATARRDGAYMGECVHAFV